MTLCEAALYSASTVPASPGVAGVASNGCPALVQAVVCDLMREGHFARHIKRMRLLYAAACTGAGRIAARLRAALVADSGPARPGTRSLR